MASHRDTTLGERFRAARDRPDLALLEGFHPLKHALRFGADVLEAVAADPAAVERSAAALAPDVVPAVRRIVREVDAETLEAIAPAVPVEVVAIARRPDRRIGAGPAPVVALDRPRHLGNVGAAIRVAAAAGAAGVLAIGEADPWHPAAIRGAAGLQFALPVARADALPALGRPLVALDPAGEPFRPEAVPAAAVLAFGSERRGLGADIRAAADTTLALPMREGVSSLNLATAVAATLYALLLRPGGGCA